MSEDNLRASLGADHMQPVETRREMVPFSQWASSDGSSGWMEYEIITSQPAPAPREISDAVGEVTCGELHVNFATGGYHICARAKGHEDFCVGPPMHELSVLKAAPTTREISDAECEDFVRQAWSKSERSSVRKATEHVVTISPFDKEIARYAIRQIESRAPQTAPRDPYKRGQLLP